MIQSVLVLTPLFPNRPGDRLGNYVYDSVTALARRGLSISVLVTRPHAPKIVQGFRHPLLSGRLEVNSFTTFQEVRQVSYASVPRNYFWRASSWFHDRAVGRALKSLAMKHKPDVIHAHTEGEAAVAVRVGRDLGIPVVVTLHGINYGPRYFESPGRRRIFSSALRAAKRVILVGEPLRPYFHELCGSSDNFRVVANGFTMPVGSASSEPHFNGPVVRFISVSLLQQGKGVDIALRGLALARQRGFENWDFTIIGDGGERAALMALACSLGLNDKIKFVGDQPRDRIFALLNEADVFILPSYREAFGIAYLEAMACGLVAIGVRGQGPEAFIQQCETGFLVEPENPQSVADCVLDIAARPLAMRQIGLAAAALVRAKFTWDEHASRLLEVYREVVH